MRLALLTLTIASLAACATPADEDLDPVADRMVEEANRWKPGDVVPPHLLELREASEDGYCIGLVTDTAFIYDRITNYPVLLHVVPLVNARLLAYVVERAALLAGPTRFFRDLRNLYAARSDLLQRPEHKELSERLAEPHAQVESLFIDHKDMADDERKVVLERITSDLRRGECWEDVHDKYQRMYSYVEKAGPNAGHARTKVGNHGDFVVSTSRRTALPFRQCEIPEAHVRPLLAARKGDVVILDDEVEKETILYKILDSYRPSK